MRWATNRWYSVNSFSGWSGFGHRALTDECVCVPDMSIRSAGRPVASVSRPKTKAFEEWLIEELAAPQARTVRPALATTTRR